VLFSDQKRAFAMSSHYFSKVDVFELCLFMLTKGCISYCNNTVKTILWNIITTKKNLKCHLVFRWESCKFQQPLLQYSVSHVVLLNIFVETTGIFCWIESKEKTAFI